MSAQNPVGGADVPVTRFQRGSAPQVTLRFDRDARGVVTQRGPEQSVVRWVNGNETVACNDWLEQIGGEAAGPLAPEGRTSAPQQASGAATPAPPPTAPKRKAPPDSLGNKVAEHCDDQDALRRFAVANGCWEERYSSLPNPGLVRMNVVNRLRAKVRKGYLVIW